MAKKKPRPMTRAEKERRTESRKEFREQGLLPPVKKPLNRKQFAVDVLNEYKSELGSYGDIAYIQRGIGAMVGCLETSRLKVTPEEVGVLKMLKLAVEMKRFEERIKAEGRTSYTHEEYYEQVYKPVMSL